MTTNNSTNNQNTSSNNQSSSASPAVHILHTQSSAGSIQPHQISSPSCITSAQPLVGTTTTTTTTIGSSINAINPHLQIKTRKETLEAKRERKAAKTLAIITGAFVVCWLPFFIMALLLPLCESCHINDKVAAFFLWLGYFNSTLNPVIYTIFSPEFRQAFKRILFGTHRSGYYRGGKL